MVTSVIIVSLLGRGERDRGGVGGVVFVLKQWEDLLADTRECFRLLILEVVKTGAKLGPTGDILAIKSGSRSTFSHFISSFLSLNFLKNYAS